MSIRNRTTAGVLLLALTTLGLVACGGGSEGGGGSAMGAMSVSLTDAPLDDAQEVWIQVHGIAFKREGAAPEVVQNLTPSPRRLDLLEYQQGRVAVLLDHVPFEAGRYEWLRLIVDTEANVRDSYLMIDGQECELRVPSGSESGLKLNRGFTVPASGSLALTIDFDLRKSVHAPPGQASGACAQGYLLRPTLRVVDDAAVGALAGQVTFASGSVPVDCRPRLYVYEGTVTPDDLEESTAANPDVDPLAVVEVEIPDGGSTGTYKAAFLPGGSYTAAFTCDDDTSADETLAFTPAAGMAVTVQNNLITQGDITVPAPAGP